MQGLMMDAPLLVSSVLEHAARIHGTTEIVARTAEGGIHRTTYAEAHQRAKQLAKALARLGVQPGDRVASLAWNTHHHFELFYGVSGSGAVLHTINPRLFEEQLVYIVNHAEDSWICVDAATLAIAEKLAPQTPGVKGWIYMSVEPEPPKSSLEAAELREAARRRGRRLRVAAVRREAGLGDLLHLGHDRPAQGRGQHAPLDDPERAGHEHGRHDRRLPLGHARGGDADRADVPRQRLADGLYRAAQRPDTGAARPQLRARQALRDHGGRGASPWRPACRPCG